MRKDSEFMVGRHSPSKGTKHKTPNINTGKTFLQDHKHFNDFPNTMNFLRIATATLKKNSLKDVASTLHKLLYLLRKTYEF